MDFCVACGATLPTESGNQVCKTCRLTKDIKFITFNCPECGEPMTIYYKQVIDHREAVGDAYPFLQVDLIYHCGKCGCDWDSTYVYNWGDTSQSAPTRHYWG